MDIDKQRGELSGSHRSSFSATSSWSSDDPVPHLGRNFDAQSHRGGFSSDGYHYQNRRHQNDNLFNAEQNGFVGGGAGDPCSNMSSSFPARKRQFSHSGLGAPPDCSDGGGYVKLYVVGIPRPSTEEEIRPIFEVYGNIVEIVLLKDKRTGQQQECCFVKYTALEEADRAIGALNNKYTFPGGALTLKVRYAEGERDRFGSFGEHVFKLYVNGLNKQASRREIEDIFSAYGIVEDTYIVRDELKQSRGCGFIQYSRREMAVAAKNALNGTYVMRGCDQPLIVRFADPKKPRVGDPRNNSKFGGSGIRSHFQEPVVSRPVPHLNNSMTGHMLPNVSHPFSPKIMASSSQSPRTGGKSDTVCSTSTASELASVHAVHFSTQIADLTDCDWSEHTCPDGYKYYYNCVTCESRWEKPQEYFSFEQQLKKQQEYQQQRHSTCEESRSPLMSQVEGVPHMQQVQIQTQLSHLELQRAFSSPSELDHAQVQAARSPLVRPTCG